MNYSGNFQDYAPMIRAQEEMKKMLDQTKYIVDRALFWGALTLAFVVIFIK